MSYVRLPGQEPKLLRYYDHDVDLAQRRRPNERLLFAVACFALSLFCTALGAVAGYAFCLNSMPLQGGGIFGPDGRLTPAGSIKTTMVYNRTFSDPPTIASETAWNDLAPIGGAFVKHPVSAPTEASVAVYHQLHCLHGIRLSYYYALSQTNSTLKEEIGDQLDGYGDHDLQHTVHCFDYIRQALMCAADSNLEVFNPSTNHVDSFGAEKKCRDLDALTRWAIEFRTSNRTGITTDKQRPGILNGGIT